MIDFVPVPSDGGERCDPSATFGSAIDLFGDQRNPPPGVTTVDTTFMEPGSLRDPGCPLHGIGCPPHCPILLACANIQSHPSFVEFKKKIQAMRDELTALQVVGQPPKGTA